MTCLTPGCKRARIPVTGGIAHAHCADHERRLLAEAFGPQSWQDRAATNILPPLVVGGVPIHSTPRSGPVALSPLGAGSDQAAEGRAQPVAG